MEEVHSFHDWLEINNPDEDIIPDKIEATGDMAKVNKPTEPAKPPTDDSHPQLSASNPAIGYYKYWDNLTNRVLKAKYKNKTDSFECSQSFYIASSNSPRL